MPGRTSAILPGQTDFAVTLFEVRPVPLRVQLYIAFMRLKHRMERGALDILGTRV